MPHKRKDLKIEGANLWYLVGLITSDGCLSTDGRHIDITSKDHDFLSRIKSQFGFTNKIGNKYNSTGQLCYHFQLTNRSFYEFLLSIGLKPCKSLTLQELSVSKNYFCDFLRGLVDGDGCIRRWRHTTNFGEQWSLRIYSGSRNFLEWLAIRIRDYLQARGKIHWNDKRGTTYVLKFGKMAAREIVKKCYYGGCFGLLRKTALAKACIESSKGWTKSRTIITNNN